MGKLKEKLLNNLTDEEMDDIFGISSFEYVEYMEKYKNKWQQLSLFDDNGDEIPNDVLEQMATEREQLEKQFIESIGEFNHEDYIKNVHTTYETGAEFKGGIRIDSDWGDEQSEIDEINDSIKLKYSDSDVISAIKSVKDEQWFINRVMKELNGIWNTKNGVE
jgi:hypothetical protein